MMRGSINLVQKQAHKKRFDIKGIQEGGSDAEEVTVPRSNNLMGGRKDANYLASKIQFWTRRNEESQVSSHPPRKCKKKENKVDYVPSTCFELLMVILMACDE